MSKHEEIRLNLQRAKNIKNLLKKDEVNELYYALEDLVNLRLDITDNNSVKRSDSIYQINSKIHAFGKYIKNNYSTRSKYPMVHSLIKEMENPPKVDDSIEVCKECKGIMSVGHFGIYCAICKIVKTENTPCKPDIYKEKIAYVESKEICSFREYIHSVLTGYCKVASDDEIPLDYICDYISKKNILNSAHWVYKIIEEVTKMGKFRYRGKTYKGSDYKKYALLIFHRVFKELEKPHISDEKMVLAVKHYANIKQKYAEWNTSSTYALKKIYAAHKIFDAILEGETKSFILRLIPVLTEDTRETYEKFMKEVFVELGLKFRKIPSDVYTNHYYY